MVSATTSAKTSAMVSATTSAMISAMLSATVSAMVSDCGGLPLSASVTVGTYYRHIVYFQYNQLSSLGALSSQCMQSKSKKII